MDTLIEFLTIPGEMAVMLFIWLVMAVYVFYPREGDQ